MHYAVGLITFLLSYVLCQVKHLYIFLLVFVRFCCNTGDNWKREALSLALCLGASVCACARVCVYKLQDIALR